MLYDNRPIVEIAHIPTGITARCQDRSVHKARNNALRLLKARLWAARHPFSTSDLVATYNLPEGKEYPDNLQEFKNE